MGTCVEFGPTQLPVGLGLGLGLRRLGLGLRLELGLGLGPNLIDRKLGGPEPDTSAGLCIVWTLDDPIRYVSRYI